MARVREIGEREMMISAVHQDVRHVMNTDRDIVHGVRMSQIGGWNVPPDIFLNEREILDLLANTYQIFVQTADPVQSSMDTCSYDMGLNMVLSINAEQNDICCPLNDIIMCDNVALGPMDVHHIDVDENTVDDGFDSHGTEAMLRNGMINGLKIKENTSLVNADNIKIFIV